MLVFKAMFVTYDGAWLEEGYATFGSFLIPINP